MDSECINQIVSAVIQMRDSIEAFYKDNPERQEAARKWWEEHNGDGKKEAG